VSQVALEAVQVGAGSAVADVAVRPDGVNGHLYLPALRIALEATAATPVTSTNEDAA